MSWIGIQDPDYDRHEVNMLDSVYMLSMLALLFAFHKGPADLFSVCFYCIPFLLLHVLECKRV